MTTCIEDVGDNFLNQLKRKIKTFQQFSLAFDKSTDNVYSVQLILFILRINKQFKITEGVAAVCLL